MEYKAQKWQVTSGDGSKKAVVEVSAEKMAEAGTYGEEDFDESGDVLWNAVMELLPDWTSKDFWEAELDAVEEE